MSADKRPDRAGTDIKINDGVAPQSGPEVQTKKIGQVIYPEIMKQCASSDHQDLSVTNGPEYSAEIERAHDLP